VQESIDICKAAGYDLIIVETSGIGQSDTEITEHCDISLYVMTPEFGAATQLEKIDMLDFADLVAINKFDKRGALDALRDVRKQYKRNHNLFDASDDAIPVYGTMASQFNDPGMNNLFVALLKGIKEKTGVEFKAGMEMTGNQSEKIYIIPPDRIRYLSEIAEANETYNEWVDKQSNIARKLYQLKGVIDFSTDFENFGEGLKDAYAYLEEQLDGECKRLLRQWPDTKLKYKSEFFVYKVRDKEIKQPLFYESLSKLQIPKVSLPRYEDWGDILRWLLTENVPGEFPYAAGVFPLKREGEDPTRMFAGEGGPERTNKRFHYVSLGLPAKRLSTAFDSVTLYGEDPDLRPDIYGKIGNAGVSICCLDDMKKLYSGFDLCEPNCSVSMTINGPAPMLAAFFMNAATDQQCEKYIKANGLESEVESKIASIYKGKKRPQYIPYESSGLPEGNDGLGLMLLGVTGDQVLPPDIYNQIKAGTISKVRGTVQADILKEDLKVEVFKNRIELSIGGDVKSRQISRIARVFAIKLPSWVEPGVRDIEIEDEKFIINL
jgi:methylmalonyl-CoA mutase